MSQAFAMSSGKDHGVFDTASDGAVDFVDFAFGAGAKRCNCKKARCLKLYCVCFSAGVYCSGCACRECLNTLENQDLVHAERSKKLAASPGAFTPKVELKVEGEMACHKKGCRCRRSRCVKKYCECFDAQVYCTASCRCESCLNQPQGGPLLLASIPHVPLALPRGGVDDMLTTLPPPIAIGGEDGGGDGSGSGASAALQERGGDAMNVGMLDAHLAAGLAAMQHRAPLASHSSLPFDASVPGSFLLSLQSSPFGLPDLPRFLSHPCGAFSGRLGEAAVSGAGGGAHQADGNLGLLQNATCAVRSAQVEVPNGVALQFPPQAPADGLFPEAHVVKPILSSPVLRRPPTSAFMFAESQAVLAMEDHSSALPAPTAPDPAARVTAGSHLAALPSNGLGTSAVGQLEGTGSGGGRGALTGGCLAHEVPSQLAATCSGQGGEARGRAGETGGRQGEAPLEIKQGAKRRNSSNPEDVVALPKASTLNGPGPPGVLDFQPFMPAASGTAVEGELQPLVVKPTPAGVNSGAAAVGMLASITAADEGVAATDGDTEDPELGDGSEQIEAAVRDVPPAIMGYGTGGGPIPATGAAAATEELPLMEAVLATPTLLMEEPLKAEALAMQLGFDLVQQLAARKAAHILRTLLAMAASAVRLTRSGALGCTRWEQSLGQRHTTSHGHSLVTPSVTCAAQPTATGGTPPVPYPIIDSQKPPPAEEPQSGPSVSFRHRQPQPCPGAAAIAGSTPCNSSAGGRQLDGGNEKRQEPTRHGLPPGRILHLPPLQLPPLSFSYGFRGGGTATFGGTGVMRLGHGSYRFSTAGRLIGPEPSMMAASRKEGTAQLSYDVAGEVVAEADGTAAAGAAGTVSGVSPGPPSSRQPAKASGGLEASYSQTTQGHIAPGGRASSSADAAVAAAATTCGNPSDQRLLRRGSRVKRPNSLLADMELDNEMDDLATRPERRTHNQYYQQQQHVDSLVYGSSRRHHHHQLEPYPASAPHLQPRRLHNTSPPVGHPSPKRSKLSSQGAGSRRGAVSLRPRPHHRSRSRSCVGSWRGGGGGEGYDQPQAEELSEGYDMEDSGAWPASALYARAASPPLHGTLEACGLGPPHGSQPPSRRALVRSRAAEEEKAAEDADDLGEQEVEAGEEDDAAVAGESGEEDEEDVGLCGERSSGGGVAAMSEGADSGGNCDSEMEAMQALFDLRTAAEALVTADAGL